MYVINLVRKSIRLRELLLPARRSCNGKQIRTSPRQDQDPLCAHAAAARAARFRVIREPGRKACTRLNLRGGGGGCSARRSERDILRILFDGAGAHVEESSFTEHISIASFLHAGHCYSYTKYTYVVCNVRNHYLRKRRKVRGSSRARTSSLLKRA